MDRIVAGAVAPRFALTTGHQYHVPYVIMFKILAAQNIMLYMIHNTNTPTTASGLTMLRTLLALHTGAAMPWHETLS